jgi:hypothetical protein
MRPRKGDTRPLVFPKAHVLAFWPEKPLRWLPRHGEPICVIEWVTQNIVKTLAHPFVYFSLLAVSSALVAVFGPPFVSG